MVGNTLQRHAVADELSRYIADDLPGLQYVVTTAEGVVFEYAGGWSDMAGGQLMTAETTLMAYSMTKTVTAMAALQLVEQQRIGLDDVVDGYFPQQAYAGRGITLRQLLNHTSGIPNPIPLRWVHLQAEDADFVEDDALAEVLHRNPKLASNPGQRFAYSNIGYWLLGKLIERVTGEPYAAYVQDSILRPLGLLPKELGFKVPNDALHAKGYLEKYSLMNAVKGLLIDRKIVGLYEGRWLRLNGHYVNGPAFGGLIGSASGFARLLRDQLATSSVILGPVARGLLAAQQRNTAQQPIPMTLGWHVGTLGGETYWFKEGGGGGFHAEMRIYPARRLATVVMANATGFHSTRFLNRFDGRLGAGDQNNASCMSKAARQCEQASALQ